MVQAMDNEKLSTIANISQLYSLMLLLMDNNNNEIMRELQNQNTRYFEDIVKRIGRIEEKLGIKNEG